MRVLRHDRVAYLRGGHLLFLLELQRQQRFPDTNIAVRRVIVFETTVETLVSKALIAVAVTRQLRDRHRYLFHCPIRIASYAGKRFRIERRPQTRLAWRHLEMRWYGFGRGVSWMVVTLRRRLCNRFVWVLYRRYLRWTIC